MRRQQLSEAQIVALFDPPTEQRELVRHYTLSDADLAMIRRCRGDHNRLGQALMLCYLRYPGRPLRAGERPPEPLLAFVAEQIDVLPQSIDDYLSAERTTVQHVAGYERQRRHATLVAISLDLCVNLTDQAVDLFDRLVGAMFRKAEGRHARAFQADARAINEKVRLYARVGAALIAARNGKRDAYGAIATVIDWERFRTTVAEAELTPPARIDPSSSAARRPARPFRNPLWVTQMVSILGLLLAAPTRG